MNRKHKFIFSLCFTTSLCLHLLAFVFFHRYSLWFSSSKAGEKEAEYLSLVDKKQRDQILRAAFEPLCEKEASAPVQHPKKESTSPVALANPLRPFEVELPSPIVFDRLLDLPKHDFPLPPLASVPFSLPSESFNLLSHLPRDLILPTPPKEKRPLFSPDPVPLRERLVPPPLPTHQEALPAPVHYTTQLELPSPEAPRMAKAPNMIPFPDLPKLPSLYELDTASYSEAFDADLVFLPNEEGNGYLFAITLIPRIDLELPRIRQHLTFLIDRSNSIQQGRLSATKSAVHKALEELSPDDTFNIIAFDSKLEKMSAHSLPCTGKSLALAEEFLEKIQLGSFFSSGDLSKSLFLTVPGQVASDELYTAILLTDGESLVKKTSQRSLLSDWTHYNGGKVSLFAIGMNNDAHIATLETAAIFNKGKLSLASTNRGMKRKLLKLLKTIRNPVAKNLSCKAISRAPQANLQLFPKATQMPHLYLDQPYVILGKTDTLDDFILFIQGRLKNRWLNIKKTISFANAKKGNKSLKQEWALQQAYQLYEQYTLDENPKYLAEAAALLEPFDYQVAFR